MDIQSQILSTINALFTLEVEFKDLANEVNSLTSSLKLPEHAVEEYAEINFMQQTEKDPKPPYLEKNLRNGLKLYIRHDFAFSSMRNSLITTHVLSQIFEKLLSKEAASDFAYAIVWDLLEGEARDDFILIWREHHPPFIEDDTIYSLPDFVARIDKPKYYVKVKLPVFIDSLENNVLNFGLGFNYSGFKKEFVETSELERKIVTYVIKNQEIDTKEIKNRLDLEIGEPEIQMIISNLFNFKIIQRRTVFSPGRMGLMSIITIFQVPRGEGMKLMNLQISNVKYRTLFQTSEELFYMNFYIPKSSYAKKHLASWVKDLMAYITKGSDSEDAIPIKIHAVPLIGIEDESLRVLYERPELLNIKNLDLSIKALDIPETEKIKPIEMSRSERLLISKIVRSFVNLDNNSQCAEIEKSMNVESGTIDRLVQSSVIKNEFVIPFAHNHLDVLCIYNADGGRRELFLDKLASKIPISVNFFFENICFNDARKKELLGISFISIPNSMVKSFRINFHKIDDDGIMALLPIRVGNTPMLNSEPTETGWKFDKLPNIILKPSI